MPQERARYGPPSYEGKPASYWIEALKDHDKLVRISAASALGNMQPRPTAAVPALIEALTDEETLVRSNAAVALGRVGAAAKDAIPALREASKDSTWQVRHLAAAAIAAIEGKLLEDP